MGRQPQALEALAPAMSALLGIGLMAIVRPMAVGQGRRRANHNHLRLAPIRNDQVAILPIPY
jgi:hypothetical protein